MLIENVLASFEMDEILYELKEHSLGLNAGRWDYIFSLIKKFSHEYVVIKMAPPANSRLIQKFRRSICTAEFWPIFFPPHEILLKIRMAPAPP